METIKSYTDIEQSKKLAKILPLESADMCFSGYAYPKERQFPTFNEMSINEMSNKDNTPCWSLVSLLNIIPKHIKESNTLRIDISEKDFSIWYDEVGCGVNTELPDITMENPVDACVEMIIRLHEQNLL